MHWKSLLGFLFLFAEEMPFEFMARASKPVKIEKEQICGMKLKSTVHLFLLYPVCLWNTILCFERWRWRVENNGSGVLKKWVSPGLLIESIKKAYYMYQISCHIGWIVSKVERGRSPIYLVCSCNFFEASKDSSSNARWCKNKVCAQGTIDNIFRGAALLKQE